MTLTSRVIDLEIATRLKELGVKQESYFYWSKNIVGDWFLGHFLGGVKAGDVSAFDVAELGEMLSQGYHTYKTGSIRSSEEYRWAGMDENNESIIINDKVLVAETEANVRGKMLIYILENKKFRS